MTIKFGNLQSGFWNSGKNLSRKWEFVGGTKVLSAVLVLIFIIDETMNAIKTQRPVLAYFRSWLSSTPKKNAVLIVLQQLDHADNWKSSRLYENKQRRANIRWPTSAGNQCFFRRFIKLVGLKRKLGTQYEHSHTISYGKGTQLYFLVCLRNTP